LAPHTLRAAVAEAGADEADEADEAKIATSTAAAVARSDITRALAGGVEHQRS